MGVGEIENVLTSRENRLRPRLKEFIRKYGIVFRHVKLSSDKETDYYYDIKKWLSIQRGFTHTWGLVID